jgi:hypothetical protein
MQRIFGRPKPKAPEAPVPTLGDAMKKLDDRVPDLEAKIKQCDDDLRAIKASGGRDGAARCAVLHLC